MIALGREFLVRGHDVKIYSSAYFERHVREAGIDFAPITSSAEYDKLLRNPDIARTFKGWRLLGESLVSALPASYRAMEADLVPGNTLVVGSLLAFSGRSIQEKHGVPMTVVHLHSSVFRSAYKQPRLTSLPPPHYAPGFFKEFVNYATDKFLLDPVVGTAVNEHRKQIGLPPVKRVFDKWLHGADVMIGLFPDWFCEPQPDWPSNLAMTGFPLYDHDLEADLPADVRAFLDNGAAPVAFTAGTATADVKRFFEVAVKASEMMGRRAILLTRFADQLPACLPKSVGHFSYVPFGRLLPSLQAFVHHGGIGSTSQALRAAVPQLIRPMAYDQFENAYHVKRFGVGDELLPSKFEPHAVAKKLCALIDNPSILANCKTVAARLTENSALAQACDVILNHAQARGGV
jgi:UDP:flavonoid glycosyltransferase YjiC (YdhE family)